VKETEQCGNGHCRWCVVMSCAHPLLFRVLHYVLTCVIAALLLLRLPIFFSSHFFSCTPSISVSPSLLLAYLRIPYIISLLGPPILATYSLTKCLLFIQRPGTLIERRGTAMKDVLCLSVHLGLARNLYLGMRCRFGQMSVDLLTTCLHVLASPYRTLGVGRLAQ
jgi:hypothetical protein